MRGDAAIGDTAIGDALRALAVIGVAFQSPSQGHLSESGRPVDPPAAAAALIQARRVARAGSGCVYELTLGLACMEECMEVP